jgi:GABA permease
MPARSPDEDRHDEEKRMILRCLVVANQTLGGAALMQTVTRRASEGMHIHVVVPAAEPSDAQAPAHSAAESAQRRLREALERMRAGSVNVTGAVGAADPMQVIRDALAAHRYDEIIISTLPAGISRWVHMDLPHRALREFKLPVEWIEARSDSPDEATTVHLELPNIAQSLDSRL